MKQAFKSAWRYTIPISASYIVMGMAMGLLARNAGYPLWYPIFMSILMYSGALEFATIGLIASPFAPVSSFIFGLLISARHLFYGIPLLEKYKNTGFVKPFLMFALTDETFSVSTSVDPPMGVSKKWFYFTISALDYSYWLIGTILGAVCGDILPFDTTGLDFSLTALFIVMFLDQSKTRAGKIGGVVGLVATFFALLIFGGEKMIVMGMVFILVLLFAVRKWV